MSATFLFWQNMISIHQKDFLEALAVQPGVTSVILVVQQDISAERKKMGWDVPQLKGIRVVVAPTNGQIDDLIAGHERGVHVFSGFNVGAVNAYAMKQCISGKRKIAIMSEPYNFAGNKGRLKKMKFKLDALRYKKHISFVLAIGDEGVAQFTAAGFAVDRVSPWGYFINMPAQFQVKKQTAGKCKIMYAGRLEEAKGIYRFATALLRHNANYELHVFGEGDDQEKIQDAYNIANAADKLSFTPFLKYEALLEKYNEYDWLVLPSTQKDGWGAVVSEGLLNGLKVICSTRCGAGTVIKEGWNGVRFNWEIAGDCDKAIEQMLQNKSFAEPQQLISWASKALVGDAGASYFIDITNYSSGQGPKPNAPWLT